ncbi:MAG TPA: hypothetical protein PLU71_04120 [Candidatus Dependentiae bacterium]|nr:hypothetical protein [Candidatus Dependentiae bacterium]HRQ63019.1 hypothetical protein [Candidatus Dependentiae bacterium]
MALCCMEKDIPTNVEVPTLKNILLQKCCQQIWETLDHKGVNAAEQLPCLDIKKRLINQDVQQDIQQTYLQRYGLYQKTKELSVQHKTVCCMVYDAQHDRLFLGFGSGRIGVWHASGSLPIQMLTTGYVDALACLVYDAKHNRLFFNNHDVISIWDMARGEQINTLTGHTQFITCLLYDQEGDRLFSGSQDQTISIWDMLSGIRTHVLMGHTCDIRHLAYDSKRNRLFSTSGHRDDRSINVWDLAQGTCISTIMMRDDIYKFKAIWDLAYDVEHDRLITGFEYDLADNKKYIDVWNVENGKRIYRLSTNNHSFNRFTYDPHHTRLFLWGRWANLQVWDMATIVRRASPYNKNTNYDYGLSKRIRTQVFEGNNTLVCPDNQHNRLFLVSNDKIISVWGLGSFAYALCKRMVDKVKTGEDLYHFMRSTSYKQLSDTEQLELGKEILKKIT